MLHMGLVNIQLGLLSDGWSLSTVDEWDNDGSAVFYPIHTYTHRDRDGSDFGLRNKPRTHEEVHSPITLVH